MSVSEDEKARFVPIIDSILAASDLNKISAKRIRKGLQAAVDYDLTEKKDDLQGLIMARFDHAIASAPPALPNASSPKTNGHASSFSNSPAYSPPPTSTAKKHNRETSTDDVSEPIDEPKPKKKRRNDEDSDAAYAAKLQAMENQRIRNTRGGGAKPGKVVKKKTPTKKKSAGRVKAEDDSELDGSGSEAKERKVNRNTGFHKELMLSPSLSALLDNETKLSRPQTVKRIWAYIRARDLQDPNDKRMIRCDDAMRAVFKQDKIHMFTMNKFLNQNLYAVDE